MLKVKLLLTLVAGTLVVIGGMQTFVFFTNLHPKTYTVESYLAKQPPEKWLHFTGGQMNMLDMAYSSLLGIGPISEIYLPLKPIGAKAGEPDRILVKTKDDNLLQLAAEIRSAKTEQERASLLARRGKDLLVRRDVEGFILEGVDLENRELDKIKRANPDLPENFIILAEGKRPDIGSVFLFFVGIVLSFFLARHFYKNGLLPKPSATAGVPPPPPPPLPLPGAGAVPSPLPK
jgi:hypothetical protein